MKYTPVCGKAKPTGSLPVFAMHLKKCKICRDSVSQELKDEIKEKYNIDLDAIDSQETGSTAKKKLEVKKEERKTQETPEKEEKISPEERIRRADQQLMSLPSMKAMQAKLAEVSQTVLELGTAVKTIANYIKQQPQQIGLTKETPENNEKPKNDSVQLQTDQTQGTTPPSSDTKPEMSPEEIAAAERYLAEQKKKRGMVEPVRGEGGADIIDQAKSVITSIRELVSAFKGGGGQPPPPTPEALVTKALERALSSDPTEWLLKGMEMEAKRYENLIKMITSGRIKPTITETHEKAE